MLSPNSNKKSSSKNQRRPSTGVAVPELIEVFNGDFKEMLYKNAVKMTLKTNLTERVKRERGKIMTPRVQTPI